MKTTTTILPQFKVTINKNVATPHPYGFQGQEADHEIKGEGNSVNYKYRMHDTRIGRFFAVDPLAWKFPYLSPYQFASNSPIVAVELEGLESSVRLNYNEGSIELRHDGVKWVMTKSTNLSSTRTSPSSGTNLRNMPEEGGYIEFWQPSDINPEGGRFMIIEVGTASVIRKETKYRIEEVKAAGTEEVDNWVPKETETSLVMSALSISSEMDDFSAYIEKSINALEKGAKIKEINFSISKSTLAGSDSFQKEIQKKYPKVKVNFIEAKDYVDGMVLGEFNITYEVNRPKTIETEAEYIKVPYEEEIEVEAIEILEE